MESYEFLKQLSLTPTPAFKKGPQSVCLVILAKFSRDGKSEIFSRRVEKFLIRSTLFLEVVVVF